jgi:hypothetical protein
MCSSVVMTGRMDSFKHESSGNLPDETENSQSQYHHQRRCQNFDVSFWVLTFFQQQFLSFYLLHLHNDPLYLHLLLIHRPAPHPLSSRFAAWARH